MSLEERLRDGLAANTARLQPNVDLELGALLGRAQRWRRMRRIGISLTLAAAAAGGALVLSGALSSDGAGGRDRDTLAPAVPAPGPSAAPVDGATPLRTMSGALPPGTYAAAFPRADADTLAIVEVPEGFTTDGTALFLDRTDSGLRAVAFWTVAEVAADPCHGSTYHRPGPTVQDLATALASQPLRGITGDPVPVSLDGHDGLYLELAVPTDLDVDECRTGKVERWRYDQSDRRWQAVPGEHDRIWILDVDGQRVVINAVHTPGTSTDDIDQLTRIVESTTFSNTDEQ